MIAYFDTSAVVPLLVEEAGSEDASRLWGAASRVVSCRLLYPEARAALAQAHRVHRLTWRALRQAVAELDQLVIDIDMVEIDDVLATRAGELAEQHALRAYDAVHLAAAEELADDELVVVSGDLHLLRASVEMGVATAVTR